MGTARRPARPTAACPPVRATPRHVRLVVVADRRGDLTDRAVQPIRRRRGRVVGERSQQPVRGLEPGQTRGVLRCDPEFGGEPIRQIPSAPADLAYHVGNPSPAAASREQLPGTPEMRVDGGVRGPPQQHLVQNREPLAPVRSSRHPLPQLPRVRTEQITQIDHPGPELGDRRTQQRPSPQRRHRQLDAVLKPVVRDGAGPHGQTAGDGLPAPRPLPRLRRDGDVDRLVDGDDDGEIGTGHPHMRPRLEPTQQIPLVPANECPQPRIRQPPAPSETPLTPPP